MWVKGQVKSHQTRDSNLVREGEKGESEQEREKKVWFKGGPRKRQEATFSPEPFGSISQGKRGQVRGSPGPPTPFLMNNSATQGSDSLVNR